MELQARTLVCIGRLENEIPWVGFEPKTHQLIDIIFLLICLVHAVALSDTSRCSPHH